MLLRSAIIQNIIKKSNYGTSIRKSLSPKRMTNSELHVTTNNNKYRHMKMITQYTLVLALLISAQNIYSQESKEQQIDSLKVQKERIVTTEKALLKDEVSAIKIRLENNEITQVEADSLKQVAAKKRALNIDNRTVIIDNQIALLKRNDDNYF